MLRKYLIEVLVMTFIGAVLALIGPFGSFALPFGTRLVYWVALIVIGFPLYRLSSIVAHWLAAATHMPVTAGLLITIGLASIPMTAIVAAMFFQMKPGDMINWNGVGQLYLQVWLIAVLVTGLTNLLFRDTRAAGSPVEDDSRTKPLNRPHADENTGRVDKKPVPSPTNIPPDSPPNFDLPLGFGPVLALQSEDHYVRVHGDHRSHLILMRLRDAIALMPSDIGMQVHRSWWVAKTAVTSHEREGRAVNLILSNGSRVPVSRDNVATARTSGLI